MGGARRPSHALPSLSRYLLKACATPSLVCDADSDVGRAVIER
jgi:hypothetical protein